MSDSIEISKALVKLTGSYINTGKYTVNDLDDLLIKINESLKTFSSKNFNNNIEKHLYDDHFVCLKCNQSVILLNKHIKKCHSMTFDEYKSQFKLPNDYPNVPVAYSKKRSSIAKVMKLGKISKKKKS
jgi:predicted transcriptional regulator